MANEEGGSHSNAKLGFAAEILITMSFTSHVVLLLFVNNLSKIPCRQKTRV